MVYVVPQYPYSPYPVAAATPYVETPPPPEPAVIEREPEPLPPPIGILRIDVEPKEWLQIYVDGVYVGSPADLGDEIGLTPGVRRLELRARGYKTLTLDVEIIEHRSISYRGVLERDPASPDPPPAVVRPPAPSGSKTMYLIPGCYLGNVEPKQVNLRPGCDISKLTTITP